MMNTKNDSSNEEWSFRISFNSSDAYLPRIIWCPYNSSESHSCFLWPSVVIP